MTPGISPETLHALQSLDTCTVARSIETFQLRLRNEGYTGPGIRCQTGGTAPAIGYAVTARILCSSPPVTGGTYVERTDWWDHILTTPGPRIVVIEDADERPGTGAFIDEVHAGILQSLGCVAAVTNGSVRNLPQISRSGFQVFARHPCVSHAYVHVLEFGVPVTVGGLVVHPGDLLHADCHGVLSVPHEIAERERQVLAMCQAGGVTVEKLRHAVRDIFN